MQASGSTNPKTRELIRKLEDLASVNSWPLSTTIKKALTQFLEDHYPNFPAQPIDDDTDDEN